MWERSGGAPDMALLKAFCSAIGGGCGQWPGRRPRAGKAHSSLDSASDPSGRGHSLRLRAHPSTPNPSTSCRWQGREARGMGKRDGPQVVPQGSPHLLHLPALENTLKVKTSCQKASNIHECKARSVTNTWSPKAPRTSSTIPALTMLGTTAPHLRSCQASGAQTDGHDESTNLTSAQSPRNSKVWGAGARDALSSGGTSPRCMERLRTMVLRRNFWGWKKSMNDWRLSTGWRS